MRPYLKNCRMSSIWLGVITSVDFAHISSSKELIGVLAASLIA
jgi:hypothetical protein